MGHHVLFSLLFCCIAYSAAARVKRILPDEVTAAPKWNSTTMDKLKRDLMLNYDKFVRPGSENNATFVSFDPTINHISMDEEQSIMAIHCWVKMSWMDEKLKWKPQDYGGITMIHMADHEIWQPDVVPYNSATGSSIDSYGNTHAIVYSDGKVLWVPPAILKVFCELDLRKWPYDTQECMLKVGSWTYSGMQINLNYSSSEPEFEGYIKNAEWKFVDMKRYRNERFYACCEEPYIDLVFNLTVSRQSPTYKSLIFTPITAIVFMTLATFWLPVGSTDKLTLAGTTALVISLFLLFFTQKLSIMAGQVPYVVSFYSSTLYLVAFSVVISVLVINLASSKKSSAVPWIIQSVLDGWLGRILLLDGGNIRGHASLRKGAGDESGDSRAVIENEIEEGTSTAKSHDQDWRMLAAAIDRIAFLVYCFMFSCFALSYLT